MFRILARSAVVALALSVLCPAAGHASRLPEGFQMAQWGMTIEDLRERIRNLAEDVDRFQPHITVYTSYSFPNNGFSEYRLFQGKLFYIRVKLTSKDVNQQMYSSFTARYGQPISQDEKDGAKRYLWEDAKTSMALYLYPYHAEIRVKSVEIATELARMQRKNEDYDRYLDEMMSRNFSDESLTVEEKQRLLELKKGLSTGGR